MIKMRKLFNIVGLAAISTAAFVPTAGASQIGGYNGKADSGSQENCFNENWNGVTNTGVGSCSSAPRWDIPLSVSGTGQYTPNIDVFVNGASSNVSCTVQGVNQNGTDYSNTGWVSPSMGNSNSVIVPGTVTVPTYGTLEAACYISSGSAIYSVKW